MCSGRLKEVSKSKSPFGNEFKIPKERLTKVYCLVKNQQILLILKDKMEFLTALVSKTSLPVQKVI